MITCQISVSLDGFVAGPDQSLDDPIGKGGLRLHEWIFGTAAWARMQGQQPTVAETPDSVVLEHAFDNVGAYIMGRHMFTAGRGEWDLTWRGWWGDDPPYHTPVYVLTHHPREPLVMQGGTTFNFVTEGIAAALEQATAAADGRDVAIAGGASTVNQYLAAGLLDELYIHLAPVLLGAGERLLEDVGDPSLELVSVVDSPAVTHIKYRVIRQP